MRQPIQANNTNCHHRAFVHLIRLDGKVSERQVANTDQVIKEIVNLNVW
jgi:hypothetical protein|tara:strand:+ start:2835 stop:2981 length:147 start_codon:yes stop_codon:yes gene_type:complete